MHLRQYYKKYKFLFKRINIFEYQDLLQEFYLMQVILKKHLNTSLFIKGLLKKCNRKKRACMDEIDIDDFPVKERDSLLNEYYSIWGYDSSYE